MKYPVTYPMRAPAASSPSFGYAGIGGDFIKGFVATGTLAAIQGRGTCPAIDRRTLRLALQGGVALAVGADGAVLVGEPHPGPIARRLAEHAHPQVVRQTRLDRELGPDQSVHLGMGVAAHEAARVVADDLGLQSLGEVPRVVGFARRGIFLGQCFA